MVFPNTAEEDIYGRKSHETSRHAHQQRAYDFACRLFGLEDGIIKSRGVALLLEMGCGKRLVSVAISGALAKEGKVKRVLVVAPLSILGVWREEYAKFADFSHEVTVLMGSGAKKKEQLAKAKAQPLQIVAVNYESAWRLEDELLVESYRNEVRDRHLYLLMEVMMKEKHIEQKLVLEAKKRGGICPKLVSSGLAGMPDRLILLPNGKMGFAELKATGKKPRPIQVARISQLRRMGFKVYVVDGVEQIGSVLDGIEEDA